MRPVSFVPLLEAIYELPCTYETGELLCGRMSERVNISVRVCGGGFPCAALRASSCSVSPLIGQNLQVALAPGSIYELPKHPLSHIRAF